MEHCIGSSQNAIIKTLVMLLRMQSRYLTFLIEEFVIIKLVKEVTSSIPCIQELLLNILIQKHVDFMTISELVNFALKSHSPVDICVTANDLQLQLYTGCLFAFLVY